MEICPHFFATSPLTVFLRYLGEEANWICLIAAAFLCKSNSSAFFSYASITQLNASLPQIIFNTPTLNSVSETCHNLVPLILGLLFHVICIFCSHPALVKIHTWKLFACGKIFAHGNIKSRRKFLVKKKPKKQQQQQTGPERKERIPFLQEKKKNFGKSDCCWRIKLHAGFLNLNREVTSKLNLSHIELKRRLLLFMQVPALIENINNRLKS